MPRSKPHSEETKQKMSEAQRGSKNHRYGKHITSEHRQKLHLATLGNQYNFRGDNITYTALHKWVRKYLPIPERCQSCNRIEKLELANMTGIYNREFHNWKYLCIWCHKIHDRECRVFKECLK